MPRPRYADTLAFPGITRREDSGVTVTAVLPEPAEELAPGTIVDHYVVIRLIGRGGMGEVYLARDGMLGRRVALKLIHPELLGSAASLERFLFEARTTARFNHPNIVTVYGVGEHRGRPYVALSYVEGETLDVLLERKRMAPCETLRIAAAIGEALIEAHRHGVLHRDLKPANVFLTDSDSRVQVLDFGLAKQIAARDNEETIVSTIAVPAPEERSATANAGTPTHMAPEQWRGEPSTCATDVWALGVMIFEMVTGRRPFEAPELTALALTVCSDDSAPRLEGTPSCLADVVASCLSKEPAARPSAFEVARRLRRLLDEEEATALCEPAALQRNTPTERWPIESAAWQQTSRRDGRAWRVVLAFAAIAAICATLLVLLQRPRPLPVARAIGSTIVFALPPPTPPPSKPTSAVSSTPTPRAAPRKSKPRNTYDPYRSRF